MSKHNDLGLKGEGIARDYLIKRGYVILETNFRSGHRELDIIALQGNLLIFVEVKTRSSLIFGFPEEAVNQAKQDSIKEVAQNYLEEHPQYSKCRFDVISIVLNEGKVKEIKHFKEVFF